MLKIVLNEQWIKNNNITHIVCKQVNLTIFCSNSTFQEQMNNCCWNSVNWNWMGLFSFTGFAFFPNIKLNNPTRNVSVNCKLINKIYKVCMVHYKLTDII